MHAMTVSTLRALRPSGLRNAPTVLEMASTPVSDEPPLANARSSTNTRGAHDETVALPHRDGAGQVRRVVLRAGRR